MAERMGIETALSWLQSLVDSHGGSTDQKALETIRLALLGITEDSP